MAYTTIDDPEAYFQTKIYTGNATDETAITLDGDTNMQPDLIWIKDRDAAQHHRVMDSVRGLKEILRADSDDGDLGSFPYTAGSADGLHSIDSDGFTLTEDDSDLGFNGSGSKTVAWCWKAGTTSGITTDAATDITPSAYSFNTTAKFSIVKYAGATTAGQLAHGLGVTPTFHMIKKTSGSGNWQVYSKAVGNTATLSLNQNYATDANAYYYNNTDPDSVNITLGSGSSNTSVNTSGQTYMCYSFADVQGYSKFGSYTGNGNADGAFVYLGFAPQFLLIKGTAANREWILTDFTRQNYNDGSTPTVWTNLADAEGNYAIDYLSNGFKQRSTSASLNASGNTYIYMAFAEAPFVNSNGVPCNAR